jgi:N-acetylmuramoyl-L-alanine amidase
LRSVFLGVMICLLLFLAFSVPSIAAGQECSRGESSTITAPPIVKKFLPYEKWTKEYKEYNTRHYKDPSLELVPRAIVMHYSVSSTFASVWNTFCNGAMYDDGDVGRVFGHLSAHFIIDSDGTIFQTLPLDRRCRGAYGVNHVALSIEMVAPSEGSLLNNRKLMDSSFSLVAYLVKQFGIPAGKVYGHYEVSAGKKRVPEYLDFGDSKCPDGYPPAYGRTDPGKAYMDKLRAYLKSTGL